MEVIEIDNARDRFNYEIQELFMDGPSKNYVYAENRVRLVVDFVLVHETKETEELNEQTNETGTKEETRKTYEKNLENVGLKLERRDGTFCNNARFTLVHAPFDLLKEQAEALGIEMPFQENNVQENERTIKLGCLDRYLDRWKFLKLEEKKFEQLEERHIFTRPFIEERLESYVGHENHDTFFESADRSRMVYDLLLGTKYGDDERQVGIANLLSNGTYTAAYPLHLSFDQSRYKEDESNDRELLYWSWCKKYFKNQPLSLVKKYFGSKIAMYFAWLGFYTMILCPAAVLGVLCTLYGVATVSSDIPSNDICESDGIGAEVMMCPRSYPSLSFTSSSASCIYAKVTYVFDNYGTVVFAAIMSILPTLFLKLWKRYHADISRKWGLLDFEVDERTNRPHCERRAPRRFNTATIKKFLITLLTLRMLRAFVSATILAVIFIPLYLMVLYRKVFMVVMYKTYGMKGYALLFFFSTTAFINVAVMLLIRPVYFWIVKKLTHWVFQSAARTMQNFENGHLYLFQLSYCLLFILCIALTMSVGSIFGRPSEDSSDMRGQECEAGGCMADLVIQLAIVMIGKPFWNVLCETYWPKIKNKFRMWRVRKPQTNVERRRQDPLEEQIEIQPSNEVNNWEQDYVLNPVDELFVIDEYVEMVIQFDFVFLLASAFPLAPLFALIRNILKIRTDAEKYIVGTRRPNPQHAKDIGQWVRQLGEISRAAVISNALIIAFVSDFIPKLVYRTVYQHENLYGFVNNSLSYYDATAMLSSTHFDSNITVCRYRDYRHPPCSLIHTDDCAANEYNFTEQGWMVLKFRLGFFVLFVVVISAIKMFIASIISDMPSRVSKEFQLQRGNSTVATAANSLPETEGLLSALNEQPRERQNRTGLFRTRCHSIPSPHQIYEFTLVRCESDPAT